MKKENHHLKFLKKNIKAMLGNLIIEMLKVINSHLTEIEKIISSELEMHGPKERKTAWVTRRVKTD